MSSVPLHYSPEPKRRRWPRRALLLLLTAACVAGLAHWRTELSARWTTARDRVALRHATSRCLRVEIPAGTVVYEEREGDAAALAPSNPTPSTNGLTVHATTGIHSVEQRTRGENHWSFIPVTFRRHPAWESFTASAARVPASVNFQLAPRGGGFSPPYKSGNEAILFLHERQTPSGGSCFVAATLTSGPGLFLRVRVWDAGRGLSPPRPRGGSSIYVLRGRKSDRIQFLAGRPDPADPTAFVLPYRINGTDGQIRGALRELGVSLSVSDGWLAKETWVTGSVDPIAMKEVTGPVRDIPVAAEGESADQLPTVIGFADGGETLVAGFARKLHFPARWAGWNPRSRERRWTHSCERDSMDGALSLSPTGRYLAIASGHPQGWTLYETLTARPLLFAASPFGALTFSPDERTFIVADQDGVRFCDVATGAATGRLPINLPPQEQVEAVAVSTRHAALVHGVRENQSVTVWDLTTGREVLCWPGHNSAAFSHDGAYLAMTRTGGALHVVSLNTGATVLLRHNPDGVFSRPRFSPDGRWLVLNSHHASSGIYLLDVPRGSALYRFEIPNADERPIPAFSPDTRTLATLSRDNVRLWNISALPRP